MLIRIRMINGINMNKQLTVVNGTNEQFCEIEFVTGLFINNVKRVSFPRQIHYLLEPIRHNVGQIMTKTKRAYRKKISLLMINIGNFYNCVDEVYGLIRRLSCIGSINLPVEFENDFNLLIEGKFSYGDGYGKRIFYIPEKFIIKEKYTPDIVISNFETVHFEIIKIKPQAISYLKQKLDRADLKRFDKIIRVFELMGKSSKDNMDFDKYIDGWAKKLLVESSLESN